MRTVIVVGIGIAVALAMTYGAKSMGKSPAAGALTFAALWFLFCAVDLAMGVKAGYSALEELGIHLGIYIVPAAGAWVAGRFFS